MLFYLDYDLFRIYIPGLSAGSGNSPDGSRPWGRSGACSHYRYDADSYHFFIDESPQAFAGRSCFQGPASALRGHRFCGSPDQKKALGHRHHLRCAVGINCCRRHAH